MDPRTLARLQALGRVGLGTALAVAPRGAAAPWLGRDARRPGTQVATRAFGARDVGLGLGAAYAAGQGTGARPWLLAGVVADTADLVATLRERRHLPAPAVVGVGLMAAGSVALGLWLSSELD